LNFERNVRFWYVTRRDLSRRGTGDAYLDLPTIDPDLYRRSYQDLATFNRITLAHRPALKWLANTTEGIDVFSLCDVGFGAGDFLRAVAVWAARNGKKANLWGIDLHPLSAGHAQSLTPSWMSIDYRTGDVFGLRAQSDIIVSSQATHHMSDEEIVELLRWMADSARIGWHNSDGHRSRLVADGVRVLGVLLGWHPVTRRDSCGCITRCFRRSDWDRYIGESGVSATVSWHAFRWCVSSA